MRKLINLLSLAALLFAPAVAWSQTSLPITMDFENETAYNSWTVVNGASGWSGSGTGRTSSGALNGSSCFMFFYSDTPPQYLISPEIEDISAPLQVTFWYKAQSTSFTESFQLGWSSTTNDVTAFTWATEVTTNVTSYQKYEALVPAGTKYISIKYTADDQFYLYIDDIVIQEPPTCLQVSGLTSTAADSTSITLAWTDTLNSGASYSISYWKNGTTDTFYTTTSSLTETIYNLDASAAYTFNIRAICSASDSSQAATATFRTTCGAISLPYIVDFEDVTSNGAWYPCWDSTMHYNTDPSVNNVRNHTTGGTYSMYLQANYSGAYNMVVSPQVPLAGDQIYVSFWAYLSSSYGWIKAGVCTNPRDTSTFIPLVQCSGSGWQEYTFTTANLDPSATYYVAWLAYGSNGQIGSFDDIVIRQDNGCNKPSLAAIDSVGPYSASFHWTSGGASASAYDLFYGTLPNLSAATMVAGIADTFYTLADLLPQTTYYAWVRTSCGSDSTEAKEIGSFTTQLTCAPVTSVALGNISYTAAQLTWAYDATVGFPTSGVQITVTDISDSNAAPLVFDAVTGTSLTINNLAAGHSYSATLRNFCQAAGDDPDTANAVNISFMTQSCSEISGDGSTNQYIPTNTYYGNTYSQMIYTAAEMPTVDTIRGIAFNITSANGGNNAMRTLDVYMTAIDTNAFNGSNYMPVDNSMKYATAFSFNSAVTGLQAITFDSAFVYDGSSNLLVTINDRTGAYGSYAQFASISANGRGLNSQRDGSTNQYDPASMTTGTARSVIPAIRFMADCDVPSCFAPMVSVVATDSNLVTLSWVSVGTESSWAVGYRVAGTSAYTFEPSPVSDTFFTFQNLNANTLYDFVVGSLCSGDTIRATLSAKTLCGAMVLPFSTSFEADAVNATPSCWTVITPYTYSHFDYSTWEYVDTDYPTVVSDGAHTGSNALGFVSSGVPTLIASSALPANDESLMIGFWAHVDDYDGDASPVFEAGIMTDLTSDSTFVPMLTIPSGDNFVQYEFATPVLSSDSNYYLAFRYNCTDQYGYYAEYATTLVDDIEIRGDDGCHRSTNVLAYGIDTNEISVSWANDGTMANYAVRYRERGTATWTTIDNLSVETTTLSNLATATAYEIMVGTVCSTDTLWTLAVFAKTTCAPMQLPYSTSFETETIGDEPACWNLSGATGSDSYSGTTYPSVQGSSYGAAPHTGSQHLEFYLITGTSIVSSEAVPLDGDSIYVSFWAMLDDYNTPVLEAGVMTNPAVDSTFIPLVSVAVNSGNYTFYEFTTSALEHDSVYYVAFRYSSTYSYAEAFIDDINIRKDEGCMYPSNVTTTATTDSITVFWTNNGTAGGYVIAYSTGGGTETLVVAQSDTMAVISGLQPATVYDIRVGDICGADTLWVVTSAQTPCVDFDVPYIENFYSLTMSLPPCWDFTDPSKFGFNNWVEAPGVPGHTEPGDGTMMAGQNSAYVYAILPRFNASFAKLQISFKAKLGNISEGDSVVFGVYDDATNTVTIAGKMANAQQSRENSVVFTYNYLNYIGPGDRIAISHSHNKTNEWGMEIDSLVVIALPDCFPPVNPVVHNTMYPYTADDVYFTWTPQGDANQWQVYMDTITSTVAIDSVPDSLLITVNDTIYTPDFGQLAEGAKYRFFVRSKCSDIDYSNWVELQNGVATDEVWMNNTGNFDTIVGCDFIIYDNGGPVAGYLHNSNSALIIQSGEDGRQVQIQTAKLDFGAHTPSIIIYDGIGTTGTQLFSYNTASTSQVYTTPIATSTNGALTIVFTSGYSAAAGYELEVHCIGEASCPKPTTLIPTITSTGNATVTWEGSSPNYRVYYKLNSDTVWTTQLVSTNSISLTGLADSATYDLYVRAICSATDSSVASNQIHFLCHYTEPQDDCPAVSDLVATNVTTNSAHVGWTAPQGSTRWEVEIVNGSNVNNVTTTQNPYKINGLQANTLYRVRVRTVCNEEEELYSEWSDYLEITTKEDVGIDDVDVAAVRLYPNPASTSVTVDLSSIDAAVVTMVDLNGRVCGQWSVNSSSLTIDLSSYARGAYFVRIAGEQGVAIRKLVVK